MTRVSPLFRFMPYGAPELLDAGRPNLARALFIASTLGAFMFALLGVVRIVHPTVLTVPRMPVVDVIEAWPSSEVQPLLPESHDVTPQTPASTSWAVDDVLPDALVTPGEVAFGEAGLADGWGVPGDVTGGEVVLDNRATAETLPERGAFVNAEVMPEALREVKPVYPEMAKELGHSGLVLVHMLVGRNGRVLNAVVDEHRNDPMFNEASLAAARQWIYRPASHNGRTVAVWVTVPFKYTFIPQ